MTPSEFREDFGTHKTRMNGLSCGEEIMTITSAVLIQYQRVTDRRTDRRPAYISITCFCIADARKNDPGSRPWYGPVPTLNNSSFACLLPFYIILSITFRDFTDRRTEIQTDTGDRILPNFVVEGRNSLKWRTEATIDLLNFTIFDLPSLAKWCS